MRKRKFKKILIVQLCRMGDTVQTLPLLKRLKAAVSPCEVTLLGIRESTTLVRDTAFVDRFVSVPFSSYKEIEGRADSPKLTLLLNTPELREKYDLVINLTHDLTSSAISAEIRSSQKSGRLQGPNRETLSLADDWSKYLFSSVRSRDRAENLFNLVDIHIGMGGIKHKAMKKWLDVGEDEAERSRELLRANGWGTAGKLVALQMGANQIHRAWPVSRFVALAQQLMRYPGVEIALLGSPGERRLGEEFALGVKAPVINLIGNTEITDLPALLANCDLLVSNDTGTAHIAAGVGTKVLGLYFSTAFFGETAPYGAGHVIAQVEIPCCPCLKEKRCKTIWCKDMLTVEAVSKAAETMLFGLKDPVPDFPGVALYRSRFLSNGTLIYTPISATIPERFQTGFLNRIFWEAALGLKPDLTFIDEFWTKMENLAAFRSKIEAYRREYGFLGSLYREAVTLLQAGGGVDGVDGQGRGRSSIQSSLQDIEVRISRMGPSRIHNFHCYEMMTSVIADPRPPDKQSLWKYSKLERLVRSSLTAFDKVCFSARKGNRDVVQENYLSLAGSRCEERPESARPVFEPGEVLHLGLSSGKNFGWGGSGNYPLKELSRRISMISLGELKDLAANKALPG